MTNATVVSELLKPYDAPLMRCFPVSTRINSVFTAIQNALCPWSLHRFRLGSSFSGTWGLSDVRRRCGWSPKGKQPRCRDHSPGLRLSLGVIFPPLDAARYHRDVAPSLRMALKRLYGKTDSYNPYNRDRSGR